MVVVWSGSFANCNIVDCFFPFNFSIVYHLLHYSIFTLSFVTRARSHSKKLPNKLLAPVCSATDKFLTRKMEEKKCEEKSQP